MFKNHQGCKREIFFQDYRVLEIFFQAHKWGFLNNIFSKTIKTINEDFF